MSKVNSFIEIKYSAEFARLPIDEKNSAFNAIVNSSIKKFGLTFSPVSNVPSFGAGETPNDTPAHNPLSNGVPVSNDYDDVYTCSECGCFTDYLVGAGSRCRQCVVEMGG